MNVKIISCWFATSYGAYSDGLRRGLERHLGHEVAVIASNCGCGDPVEVRREFQNERCIYFEQPHVTYFKSTNQFKYLLRNTTRRFTYRRRSRRYHALTGDDADVVHFQQTLNAYGSVAAFEWLQMPSDAARVVTVHELDPHQRDFPESSLTYNLADALIVHAEEMRERLVQLGVDPSLIHVLPQGIDLPVLEEQPREGLVFYGGHKLHSGKGFETLLRALSTMHDRLGDDVPTLTIHGHYGVDTPRYGAALARRYGLESSIRWENQVPPEQMVEAYRRARACVLPYTGSFAGLPAVTAMACGTPVIGTHRAGLPDHLGEAGYWVEEENPAQLATAITTLMDDDELHDQLAAEGRRRAETLFDWDEVAKRTLAVYDRAIEHRHGASVTNGQRALR